MKIKEEDYYHVAHVGDILHTDISGAQGAGMKGIWVKSLKYLREGSEEHIIPDATISSLKELPGVLGKI